MLEVGLVLSMRRGFRSGQMRSDVLRGKWLSIQCRSGVGGDAHVGGTSGRPPLRLSAAAGTGLPLWWVTEPSCRSDRVGSGDM